jgi:hypothetical protein
MHTDLTLKQALADMETAWRRLREVLDGPDVAAALVERQAVRPMSTAPLDRTWVTLHFDGGATTAAFYGASFEGGPKRWRTGPGAFDRLRASHVPIGWSPVK